MSNFPAYQLPITLALFTTTKGHFDKDTYQYTINNFFDKIDTKLIANKVAHIKFEEGDADKLESMIDFFELKNFKVIVNKGQWKHYDQSHYVEHAKDIARLMQSEEVQSQPYVLWMEDDVIFKPRVEGGLFDMLNYAVIYLKNNPEKVAVRVLDLENILPSLQAVNDNPIIFDHKDCFSFRANIMRSRDAWALGSFFKQNFTPRVHIERYATNALKFISGNDVPFGCFNLDILKHIHIGSKDFNPSTQY